MNYKEAYEQFILDYHYECRLAGKHGSKFDKKEVITFLSKAYAYLGNTYELVEAEPVLLRLVAGQTEYTSGAANTQIPLNVLRIHDVRINNTAKTKLDKIEAEYMPENTINSGLPSRYTVKGVNARRKLIIDAIPDKGYGDSSVYGLYIHYKEKISIYFGSAATGTTFADLNFGTASTWGGEFNLPGEFDELIIMGAVAEALGDTGKKAEFKALAEAADKKNAGKTYVDTTVKYRFGIW